MIQHQFQRGATVHRDFAEGRIVTYGFDRAGAVAYGFDRGIESVRHRRGRLVRTTPQHRRFTVGTICTVEFSSSATAVASVGVCSGDVALFTSGTPLLGCVVFDVAVPGRQIPAQPFVGEQQEADDAIVEMRPAHRSLRDKSREEMSEFERKYPW